MWGTVFQREGMLILITAEGGYLTMKVTIDNFQSIKHTEFEVKGLTIITGPNNTGKSACARALAGAFTNTRGNSFVRQGEKSCAVKVEFNDGQTLLWEKGKNTNRYEINGEEIDKVGVGTPDEVKSLGVVGVEVDGKEVYPQIARQFEQVFLLDMPPSVLSSALSDVDKIQTLEQATALARNEVRSITQRVKIKSEDLTFERNRINQFEGLSEVESVLDTIAELEEDISETEAEIEELTKTMLRRTDLSKMYYALEDVEDIDLPNVNALMKFNHIPELEHMRRERNKCLMLDSSITIGLESFPVFPSLKSFEKIEGLERISQKRKEYLNSSKGLEVIQNLVFQSLEQMDLLDNDLKTAVSRQELKDKLCVADGEVSRIDGELEHLKHSIGDVCPLCSRT